MSRVCVICVLVVMLSYAYEARKSYNGYRLLQMRPTNNRQLRTLLRLQNTNSLELDFWKQPALNHDVDLLVPPKVYNEVTESLTQAKMEFKVVVTNIQTSMDIEQASMKRPDYLVDPVSYNTWCEIMGLNCQPEPTTAPQESEIEFNPNSILETYPRYNQIISWLKYISSSYSDIATLDMIGISYEERETWMIKLSTDKGRSGKPVIWIETGIHAREWIAPATAIAIIDKMVKDYRNNDSATLMLENYDWHILPCANPDGYEYSHTENRLWRKTRSDNANSTCKGVDPNRNFDIGFGGVGTSNNPCSDIYRGTHPFSEPETENIRNTIQNTKNIEVFLSFHSYSQLLLTPHGYTDSTPDNNEELIDIAAKSMNALKSVHGKKFKVGPPHETLGYMASGGTYDWANVKQGIKYTYTYELRPARLSEGGFILGVEHIEPSAEEVWASLVTMVKEIQTKKQLQSI